MKKINILMLSVVSVLFFYSCDSDSFSSADVKEEPNVSIAVTPAPRVTPGSEIAFFDISTNSPTSWAWEMPGAEPNSSTEQNPTVFYANEGEFDVTLTATNSYGSSAITIEKYITVAKPDITKNLLISLDFEDSLINGGVLGSDGDFTIQSDISAPSPEAYVAGHTGNAYAFDGANYLETSWQGITGSAARTFVAWIYISSSAAGSSNAIVSSGVRGKGLKYLFAVNSAGSLRSEIQGNGFNGPVIALDTWVHVAVTHSGSLNITGTKLYINGVEVASGKNTSINIDTQAANVILGATPKSRGFTALSKAILDELRIYDIELTSSQIVDIMNGE